MLKFLKEIGNYPIFKLPRLGNIESMWLRIRLIIKFSGKIINVKFWTTISLARITKNGPFATITFIHQFSMKSINKNIHIQKNLFIFDPKNYIISKIKVNLSNWKDFPCNFRIIWFLDFLQDKKNLYRFFEEIVRTYGNIYSK